ncbi:MAG: alanine racemase [Deltaproteobacteria bacterium]|nr:alanine racemase [Deltaproteobacteria bacterium]
MPHVVVEGVMTHFANADCDDPGFTTTQLARFAAARGAASARASPRLVHAAASAAAFRVPDARSTWCGWASASTGSPPSPTRRRGSSPRCGCAPRSSRCGSSRPTRRWATRAHGAPGAPR